MLPLVWTGAIAVDAPRYRPQPARWRAGQWARVVPYEVVVRRWSPPCSAWERRGRRSAYAT